MVEIIILKSKNNLKIKEIKKKKQKKKEWYKRHIIINKKEIDIKRYI